MKNYFSAFRYLPLIALNRRKFPGKVDFKVKIVAEIVAKISHKKSLSLNAKEYNNKIASQTWGHSKTMSIE